MNRGFVLLLLLALVFFAACSDYPDMDEDILAFHLYNSGQFDPTNQNDDYVKLLAKSFGMSVLEVRAMQKTLGEKGSAAETRRAAEKAMRAKLDELRRYKGDRSRKKFVVDVLAPYLDLLAKSSLEVAEHCIRCSPEQKRMLREHYFSRSGLLDDEYAAKLCDAFGRYFGEDRKRNTLRYLLDHLFGYDNGPNVIAYNLFNERLLKFGLYADWSYGAIAFFKVEDVILEETPYKMRKLSVLKLKRIVPELMPSKAGSYTADADHVIVLDDIVNANVDETLAEMEQIDYFEKFTDRRFDKFWHSIGLDLRVITASEVYRRLMKKDFAGKSKRWIKNALEMGVAIHEAKHIVDRIEHPDLNLNLDMEFSAYVTMTVFNPAPNATLAHAISLMQNYAMATRTRTLDNAVRSLWQMALRSAFDEDYTDDLLRQDLVALYDGYMPIRTLGQFELLDDFRDQVATKIAAHYEMELPGANALDEFP